MKPLRLQTDGTTKSTRGIQLRLPGELLCGPRMGLLLWGESHPCAASSADPLGRVHFPRGERHDRFPGCLKPPLKLSAPRGRVTMWGMVLAGQGTEDAKPCWPLRARVPCPSW